MDAQMQLSSSPLTTSSSSPQTSPDRNSSTMPSSPTHLPAQQNIPITIDPPPEILFRPPFDVTPEQALESLKKSNPHTRKLQQLENAEKGYQKDVMRHRKTARKLRKELYQTIVLYAAWQAAIIGAVATTSMFTCADLWGPAVAVGAVTVFSISGALDQLCRLRREEKLVRKFERRQSAVYSKIAVLRWRGSACSIEYLEPAAGDSDGDTGSPCIFSVEGILMLGFLAGFSAVILASFWLLLCGPSEQTVSVSGGRNCRVERKA